MILDAVMTEIATGMQLTRAQVDVLEAKLAVDPHDLVSCARVIGFYGSVMALAARQRVTEHVLWLIEHAPDAELAGSVFCAVDDDRADVLWLRHVAEAPDDARIQAHAARFFQFRDAAFAATLLARARQLDPARDWRLHEEPPPLAPPQPDDEPSERYYQLEELAEAALAERRYADAETLARELLLLASQVDRDWNYGNAIYGGNQILGMVALARADLDAARAALLAASTTPGSPQLGSFGPQMTLAHALLQRGERALVLEFFERCHGFWSMGHARLDAWSDDVRNERMPDFGSRLQ